MLGILNLDHLQSGTCCFDLDFGVWVKFGNRPHFESSGVPLAPAKSHFWKCLWMYTNLGGLVSWGLSILSSLLPRFLSVRTCLPIQYPGPFSQISLMNKFSTLRDTCWKIDKWFLNFKKKQSQRGCYQGSGKGHFHMVHLGFGLELFQRWFNPS